VSASFEAALRSVIHTLNAQIAPMVEDSFAKEATRLASLVLSIVANGLDDVVELRVQENAAIRALLRDGGELIGLPDLADAADSSDPGLRISELDAENDRLRGHLIRLHGEAERRSDGAAQVLCQRIWAALQQFEERRAPPR
jgi:hypothetical protein